jgi:hypothetical protein
MYSDVAQRCSVLLTFDANTQETGMNARTHTAEFKRLNPHDASHVRVFLMTKFID